MKTYKYSCIFIIAIIAIITSCEKNTSHMYKNVIPLESSVGTYRILNLSDYVTDIRYIPLETNDSVLISGISHIIYENDNIIIETDWKQNECLVFNDNGNFCNKIGKHGQGPNEHTVIIQTFILDDLIFLRTDITWLIAFEENGAFVKKIARPDNFDEVFIRDIQPLNFNTFFMLTASFQSYYPKTVLFEADGVTTKVIKEFTEPNKLEKSGLTTSSLEFGMAYRFKDDIRFYRYTNSDTIFTIGQDKEIKDAFILELGKYRPTQEFVEQRENWSHKMPILVENIQESSDFLFIKFNFHEYAPEPFQYWRYQGSSTRKVLATNGTVLSVFDKNTGELKLMKQPIKEKLGFKNDIDGGPVIYPHYISTKNELVTYISPEDFLDYYEQIENPTPELNIIAKNIKQDDNPIVIIAKLKK